jgi:hypothetical protein
MGQTNSLRLMFDRLAVYHGLLELLNNGSMDGIALQD